MNNIQINLVNEAKTLAISKHGNQLYSNNNSYIVHLEEVVEILKSFGYTEDKYICAGYLHDIIEDTDISYNDIKKQFGHEIAEIVYCVTDELGRNRIERKTKTLIKTKTNNDAIIIKLADRISNLKNSINSDDKKYLSMYVNEHEYFKKMLYVDKVHDNMWNYIDILLQN